MIDDSQYPLYASVAREMIFRIRRGELRTGDRVLSERELALRGGYSRGTARLALQRLESEGYLIRRGQRGSFISQPDGAGGSLRLVFAFPEENISPLLLTPENWALSSELHRGLLSGAAEHGVQVYFEHFRSDVDAALQRQQWQRLCGYDAAVFISEQLLPLQLQYAMSKPVFCLYNVPAEHSSCLIRVSYDREQALRRIIEHARSCGSGSVGALSFSDGGELLLKRGEQFLSLAREYGFAGPGCRHIVIAPGKERKADLLRVLAGPMPDFVFCNHAEHILDFYDAARSLMISLGRELKVAGMATGVTFQGLLPRLTHIKVPMYELGRKIISCLTSDVLPESVPLLQAGLVAAESSMGPTEEPAVRDIVRKQKIISS
ncbi:MAG: GntR family transcriptional regulator [Oligosphaeraceae bacterium]|nr:GntR family transcriptional regulator [Oligosphaeraceae bacterium]